MEEMEMEEKPNKFRVPKGVYVSLCLASLCLVLYVVLGFYRPLEQDIVTIPGGNLSTSIFDAQNMSYHKVSGMDRTMELPGIPYTAAAPDGVTAVVDGSAVVSFQGYYFVYDVFDGEDLPGRLKRTLTSIFSMEADPLATAVEALAAEEGYINGCGAEYSVYRLMVGEKSVYVCLYSLKLQNDVADGRRVLLGCMTDVYSTSALSACQGVAQALVGTIQYDAAYAKRLGL